MPKGTPRWTSADEDVIREHYGRLSASEIAEMIGRTPTAVYHRATRTLGLTKWEGVQVATAAKLAELRLGYEREPSGEIIRPAGRIAAPLTAQGKPASCKTLITLATVHDYFAEVATAEQAYTLGLLAADGCVDSKHPRVIFGLQAEDAHLVAWVRYRLNPLASLYRTKKGFTKIQITSRPMATDLARYGIVARKSRILQWPHNLGPLLRPFLLGYFDGDGTAYLCKGRNPVYDYPGWSACSGSEQFLVDMKEYVRDRVGIVMEKIHRRAGTSLYQVATTGLGAYMLDEWLHWGGLGLARKRFPENALARYR